MNSVVSVVVMTEILNKQCLIRYVDMFIITGSTKFHVPRCQI
jgi:hypothetical protein